MGDGAKTIVSLEKNGGKTSSNLRENGEKTMKKIEHQSLRIGKT